MTEQQQQTGSGTSLDEQISALVDGELEDSAVSRVIGALGQDEELAARWERYHLMGEVMRGGVAEGVRAGVAKTVAARLEHEPAILAPQRPRRKGAPAYLRPFASLAIAASVAVTAIVVVPVIYRGDGPGDAASSLPVAVAPQSAPVLPVAASSRATQWKTAEQRLREYLEDRHRLAQGGSPAPFVHSVGHTAE